MTTFAGIGAVLFEPSGKPVKFFSKALTTSMIHAWNPAGKKSAIYECEFFALFLPFRCCCDLHWQQRCQRCFDCWPYSKHLGEENSHCYAWFGEWASVDPWYARVLPTDSNLADGPSRLRLEQVLQLGASACEIDALQCWDALLAYARKWGEDQATVASHHCKKA
jgi:hypothetical protein